LIITHQRCNILQIQIYKFVLVERGLQIVQGRDQNYARVLIVYINIICQVLFVYD